MINRLNDATNDVTKYRFLLYSAHDTTVSAFLCALKLDDMFPSKYDHTTNDPSPPPKAPSLVLMDIVGILLKCGLNVD